LRAARDPILGRLAEAAAKTRSDDATRRTRLAGERTQLAWWRTGLTALAVGIGVGRVVPELDQQITGWPYVVLGASFALYGVLLILYGNMRGRVLDEAIERGGYTTMGRWANWSLSVGGAGLALATALLIVFG
jgi:putative membrane protein